LIVIVHFDNESI